MRKSFLVFILPLLMVGKSVLAVEGQWIPMLLSKLNASEMQAMGMKITAEEIYSLNKASLKDAIVQFGGGCTGEFVSDKGLLFTNHHCGYGNIQNHSSLEHNYLTNGFWAQSLEQELPNPDLSVKLLINMADVSEIILSGVMANMNSIERSNIIAENSKKIIKEYGENKFLEVIVKPFYYGNQYILIISKVFRDVRLVGAPPSNIGKFGGDTDNWMWPRHTGDFSVFRVYANGDNEPADYSKNNIPYQPKKSLQISLKGYKKGDFTMVFGYPGRTEEYLPSAAIEMITEKINPFAIDLRTKRLAAMQKAMDKDQQVRIQYSAKYAGIANGWKKWQGENKGIKRLNAIEKKRVFETEFIVWANKQAPEYNDLLEKYNLVYSEYSNWQMAYRYFVEAGVSIELIPQMRLYIALIDELEKPVLDTAKFGQIKNQILLSRADFYKDYNKSLDKELFIICMKAYQEMPLKNMPQPSIFATISKSYNNSIEEYANYVYSKSNFVDEEKLNKLLNFNHKDIKKIQADPYFILAESILNNYFDSILMKHQSFTSVLDSLQRVYMKAQMSMNPSRSWYPDANSTLRVSYGIIDDYKPRDGVEYNYFTTLDGIFEKENPLIYDYVVEPKLKSLHSIKNYGQYADADGSLHTCFIASNHTTGGNSGSPVLNAEGQLIGINFDRNWEGTMSDLKYDASQCRNISLDIRYCLFIIDKYAEASNLINEMNIVK